jgi:hypothetical protein
MNPGEGKVHRDCAARCISGGVPPAFLVRDAAGTTRLLILTGHRDAGQLLDYVAEPVTVRGSILRRERQWRFDIDPATIRRAR